MSPNRRTLATASPQQSLRLWRDHLLTRRRLLLGAAGGSMAALFGLPLARAADPADPWPILDAVQRHLLPSEAHAPGAVEIHALSYLQRVVQDRFVDAETRRFITQGTVWLADMSQQIVGRPFVELNEAEREIVLRRIARSAAGENWLATLLTYLMEALLCDPIYGGNPGGVGWRWLQHTPGFPHPPADKRYENLPL
ncbi:gluconate 2-dehydrogenase subunit 3 family protein [Magnetofaba australis]|uniref:Putative gluconate 2-dehydrogenase gamma chain n=1 Tax=Magnetofaba australis IT-1 TaxID=1434232 RepID=A0A1Y2KAL9_9PROT|nr:gluconate 2-dehydrogenase subunit 3 family protein [Magnetofaba australis]OSM06974.1 putative gluconate 2-dehydrogenase gamma chain [Magnetofaba australis IT-1]